MKSFITVLSLFLWGGLLAQTSTLSQLGTPKKINVALQDITNPGITHLGTDIGYIQVNTETQAVTSFQNLSSQSQPIGNIKSITQDQETGILVYALSDGIAISDGNTLQVLTYSNSGLTVGEGIESFESLKVSFGANGNIYIFHPEVEGYQEYKDGGFQEEQSLSFRPNAIKESLDGSKIYFGSSGQGLFEITKENNQVSNYTAANSDLVSDSVESLHLDMSGTLYIGSFQGLNTLSLAGEWGTFQLQVPNSGFFYPAFSIDINTEGLVLINSSRPNSAYAFGFNIIDPVTGIWTTFPNSNSACIINTVFNQVIFGDNDNIVFSPFDVFDNSKLFRFDLETEVCAPVELNYLGAPVISEFILNFGVRTKSDNTLEVGVADFDKVIMFEYDYSETEEPFGEPMFLDSGGENIFEIYGQGEVFIADIGVGLAVIGNDNGISKVNFGIDGFSSLKTKIPKKVGEVDVISPMVLGVENGESKLYYADCDLFSVNCTDWFDYSIEDLDPLEPISFGVIKDVSGDNLVATRHKKTTASNEEAAIELSKYNLGTVNGIAEAIDFISAGAAMSSSDPYIESLRLRFGESENSNEDLNPSPFVLFWQSEETFAAYVPPVEDSQDLSPITRSIDLNEDDIPDQILGINNTVLSLGDSNLVFNYFLVSTVTELMAVRLKFFRNEGESEVQFESEVIGEKILNNPPGDLVVYSSELVQTDEDSATIILYTNYGFLFKSDVDLNNISLSINEHSDLNFSNLYPNPAHDIVKITNLEVSSVQVFDLTGQLVLTSKQPSISIRNLPEGLYFVKITEITNGNSVIKKLIKSN